MKYPAIILGILIHINFSATILTVKQDSTGNNTKIQEAIESALTGDKIFNTKTQPFSDPPGLYVINLIKW